MQGIVKYLLTNYTQKQVAIITKLKRSYISKVAGLKIGANAVLNDNLNPQMQERKDLLDFFLSVPVLTRCGFTQDDKIYVGVLRHLGVPKKDLLELYRNSKTSFTKAYHKKVDIGQFDSAKLGVDKEKFLDLIEVE